MTHLLSRDTMNSLHSYKSDLISHVYKEASQLTSLFFWMQKRGAKSPITKQRY